MTGGTKNFSLLDILGLDESLDALNLLLAQILLRLVAHSLTQNVFNRLLLDHALAFELRVQTYAGRYFFIHLTWQL